MIAIRRSAWRTVLLLGAGLLCIAAASPLQAQAATLLYSDDFESDAIGALPAGWIAVSGTWTVALDGTQVMKETDTNTATAKSIVGGSASWTNYAVQAQVKPGTTAYGTSNVMAARYKDDNNSYALILKNGNQWFFGKKVAGVWTTFASGSFAYNTATWYQLELDVTGNLLSAYINGAKLASATDATFSSGAIDFMSRYLIEVDNVSVTALAPPPPPPSPSPSPSPGPSPSPSPSPSPMASPTPSPSPSPGPSPTPSPGPSPSPSPSPSPPPPDAAISGVVTDAGTGAAIAGAQVSTQPAGGTATTDSAGVYTFALPAGTYNVIFSTGGYNTNFVGGVSAPSAGTAAANATLVPVPAGVALDLFSRPDQSSFGTASDGHAWANDLNVYPTSKGTIVGRQGFIQTATAFTDHDTWMGIPYRDAEVSVDVNMTKVVQDPSFQHGARLLARVQGSDAWIVMALNPSNSTLTLWVDNRGTWTQIGGTAMPFQTNAWYHAKVDVIANLVYGKAWLFGSAEPVWQVSGTQTSLMTPGVGGLRCGAADAYFANFSETPITQISGRVTNVTNGAGLAGVTVTLSSGASTVTDGGGNYLFGTLPAGTYTVSAAPSGYNLGSVSATVTVGTSAVGTTLALSPITPPSPSPSPGATPTPSPTGK